MSWLIFPLTHALSVTLKTMRKFGGGGATTAAVQFSIFWYFWYFILCTTLGQDALSWLFFGYDMASWNHSLCQRLRYSWVALCLWLGDNDVAFSMVTHIGRPSPP
jgi:hypothetical protein